jgi:hypothetical protein
LFSHSVKQNIKKKKTTTTTTISYSKVPKDSEQNEKTQSCFGREKNISIKNKKAPISMIF